MKAVQFFRILNKKIEYYNKIASNPFLQQKPVVIIWIEDGLEEEEIDKNIKS